MKLFCRFALIIVGSEQSSRLIFDRLPRKELHGQIPQVSHFTKQALNQFEAQARKSGGGSGGGQEPSDRRDDRLPPGRDNPPNGNFINGIIYMSLSLPCNCFLLWWWYVQHFFLCVSSFNLRKHESYLEVFWCNIIHLFPFPAAHYNCCCKRACICA